MTSTPTAQQIADDFAAMATVICLYGNRDTGAGYIAAHYPTSRTFGTGDPVATRSFTEAIFAAVADLRDAGVVTGRARVFEPGGARCADVDLAGCVPYYGDLAWKPAPRYTISAAAIEAAAQ